jgi:hypothetical protein
MTTAARPSYRFNQNAVGSTSNEFGNYILKRGMGEIRKPSWQRTETVVRFLPQWSFANSRWEPFRYSPAPMDFGDWLRRYDAVRGFGANGVTFLLYDPISNPAYDMQSNPCVILHRAIQQSIDARQCEPDWPALLKGAPGQRAQLGKPGPIYLTRAAIFRIKSKDMATAERAPLGMAAQDPAFFLELPKTAGEKLVAMLEERNEGFTGELDDPAGFKYGDIVSLDQGSYVHIFEEGADPKLAQQAATSAPKQLSYSSGGGRGNYGGGGGGGSQFKGYDMRIEKTWNGFSANLNSPEMEQLVKAKQRPWEDCLQFFSHQEQACLIQEGFPAKAIMYAWRDHPEWIKDETRAKAVGRVSAGFQQPANVASPTTPYSFGGDLVGPATGQPAVVTPPATQATKYPEQAQGAAVKVGGWGQVAAADSDGSIAQTVTGKDNVVPEGLPEGISTSVVDAALPSVSKEERARAALEAARARTAGR